ncbi:MAG: DNA topoisomerase 3 [bacterium]|nr:DNA topoisomerase 3 [bacterium]
MTTVVLAEKPSVARDIARVLGAQMRGDGYLAGAGYVVTWALGHLVEYAEPDDYGPPWNERWSLAQLPMIPTTWKLKTAKKTSAQFQIVKKLLNDAATTRVICATDAGREGEHIFRLIYEHAGCRKPVQRLWISSLTDAAIRDGFGRLQDGTVFEPLAAAARARSQADWLVGMNLTRAYTAHNGVLCTIGRVQTPTLAMIVRRDQQIAAFRKTIFYELVAYLSEGFLVKHVRDGQTRIDSQQEAEDLFQQLRHEQIGRVQQLDKKVQRHRPPALYDLTTLQRDANRRFGYTAAQTLRHAQALYETHKLITYPRTESRHISADMVPELPVLLGALRHAQAPAALARLRAGLQLGKAYVDRTKLTDHHAILPTRQVPPDDLPPALARIYGLVAARFVAIFLPDQVVEETTVGVDIGGASFVARGYVVLEMGWRVVEPGNGRLGSDAPGSDGPTAQGPTHSAEGANPEEVVQRLPPLTRGQQLRLDRLAVEQKETRPPRSYTDATLLMAMKHAGRELDDAALADAMKASGLGTPATRAEMIEKLIRAGYLQRAGRQLDSTAKGQGLIGLVDESLRNPELTAVWEQQLRDVEERRMVVATYSQRIADFVRELVPRVSQGSSLSAEQRATIHQPKTSKKDRGRKGEQATDLGACPLCRTGVIMETARAYGCSRYREGCGFTIWKRMGRRRLPRKVLQQLLKSGISDQLDFVSKAGKAFAATLKVGAAGKVEFDFGDSSSSVAAKPSAPPPVPAPAWPACPKCRQGRIIQGKRGYGCDRYREGCDFVVWQQVSGKTLTETQVRTLIEQGHTRLIRGFLSPQGEKFAARLRLDGQGRTVLAAGE